MLKVAAEALSGHHTLAELSNKYGVSSAEISRWKQKLTEQGEDIFTKPKDMASAREAQIIHELQLLAGEQAMRIEVLKKKFGL
jgi:transposase-like protein